MRLRGRYSDQPVRVILLPKVPRWSNDPRSVGSWPSDHARWVGWLTYVRGFPDRPTSTSLVEIGTPLASGFRVLVAIVPRGSRPVEEEWARGEFEQLLGFGAARRTRLRTARPSTDGLDTLGIFGERPLDTARARYGQPAYVHRFRSWAQLRLLDIADMEIINVPRPRVPLWRFWTRPSRVWRIVPISGAPIVLHWNLYSGKDDTDDGCAKQYEELYEAWRSVRRYQSAWLSSGIEGARTMSPLAFEQAVVAALRRLGAEVTHTGSGLAPIS